MTSLALVRRIEARPRVVFDAVTTADGIARWWGPDAGPVLVAESDPRVGGRYRVRFRKLDGTELIFVHSQLHDEQTCRRHEQGWRGSLDKLEAYFAVGAAASESTRENIDSR
jgi:uncharacterized protein YndB with AHSA1/START domain